MWNQMRVFEQSRLLLCVCVMCACVCYFVCMFELNADVILKQDNPFPRKHFKKQNQLPFVVFPHASSLTIVFRTTFVSDFFFYFTYDVTEINDWIGWLEKSKKTNLFHKSYIKILYVLTELLLFFFYLLSSK